MLDRLLGSLRGGDSVDDGKDAEDNLPAAFAALLVEAAVADEDYTGTERSLILTILQNRFSLTADAADALLTRAEAEQAGANDLYRFSRVVKEKLSREEKVGLIESMWRIALTDGHRDPHEEMVIRRLVGLIHLEDTDSTEARRRAERGLA